MSESLVFVSITGRPNVGKSTLLNRLVGEKTAIVTPKPQTTRGRITGILTKGEMQFVFFDTPGLHTPRTHLGGHMMKSAQKAIEDGDVTLMLFEPTGALNETEQEMLREIKTSEAPAIAVINKADLVSDKKLINVKINELNELLIFKKIFIISANNGEGCDELLEEIAGYAMEGPHYFEDDMYTSQPEKEIVAEIVREKLLNNMQNEIPHGTAVSVESFKERKGRGRLIDIEVTIYCEKKSHKGMIIGKNGAMLKKIATEARIDAEEQLCAKINMQCWVKVSSDWRDNEFALKNMGFGKQ